MKKSLLGCSCFLFLISAAAAQPPGDPPATNPPAAEQPAAEPAAENPAVAEIRANAAAYVEAYNKRDADAVAAMWSPDAVYTSRSTGEQLVGQAAIAEDLKAAFEEDKDSKLEVTVNEVKFVSPNVAVEYGEARLIHPEGEPIVLDYSAVHVKREGKWLLDRVTEEEVVIPLTNYEHLKELEWMIGNWVDDSETASVVTECNWTRNQNFITRSFKVVIEGESAMSGMQVIGWDAAETTICSWVFATDGGFGEAVWTRKDDRWYIKQSGVLADGARSSSVNILTRVDDDTCTWQSINRVVGGELLPNVNEVVIVRAP